MTSPDPLQPLDKAIDAALRLWQTGGSRPEDPVVLRGARLGDALVRLHAVRTLRLEACHWPDLEGIGALSQLEDLQLIACVVGSFAKISALQRLAQLNVRFVIATDLEEVLSLPLLRRADMIGVPHRGMKREAAVLRRLALGLADAPTRTLLSFTPVTGGTRGTHRAEQLDIAEDRVPGIGFITVQPGRLEGGQLVMWRGALNGSPEEVPFNGPVTMDSLRDVQILREGDRYFGDITRSGGLEYGDADMVASWCSDITPDEHGSLQRLLQRFPRVSFIRCQPGQGSAQLHCEDHRLPWFPPDGLSAPTSLIVQVEHLWLPGTAQSREFRFTGSLPGRSGILIRSRWFTSTVTVEHVPIRSTHGTWRLSVLLVDADEQLVRLGIRADAEGPLRWYAYHQEWRHPDEEVGDEPGTLAIDEDRLQLAFPSHYHLLDAIDAVRMPGGPLVEALPLPEDGT